MVTATKHLCTVLAGLSLVTVSRAAFTQINLVSNGIDQAKTIDPQLINPWGLAFNPDGNIWTANNYTSLATITKPSGTVADLSVNLPPQDSHPASVTYYGGEGFVVTRDDNSASGPARFIFGTEQGVISGWSYPVNPDRALKTIDRSQLGASYTGVTVSTLNGKDYLYAANFRSGWIDVFDSNWNYVKSFTDPLMSRMYNPYNIKAYGDYLIVTWAQSNPNGTNAVWGTGAGYIDIFTANGRVANRFVRGGELNAPYGVALEIDKHNNPGTTLFVSNTGDGRILKYDFFSGNYLGAIKDQNAKTIVIDGLKDIGWWPVKDPDTGIITRTLYFTAGSNSNQRGLLGALVPIGAPSG